MSKAFSESTGYSIPNIQDIIDSRPTRPPLTQQQQAILDWNERAYEDPSLDRPLVLIKDMWCGFPDPRHLGSYDVFYQSEAYDIAMYKYGKCLYGGLDTTEAWAEVERVMSIIAEEKHREFVLRSVC